jgi:NADH:ubiquinone oxidoreductase subunit 2 (subunit N)
VVMLVCSVLAAVYVWRLVEPMYFAGPSEAPDAPDEAGGSHAPEEAPTSLLLRVGLAAPTWALCIASILIGIDTDFSVDTAREAAERLLLGAGR